MAFFQNCVLMVYVFAFKSRIHQMSFSLSSVTETPFKGTSSDELSTDSSVWVWIVVPLLLIFIIVVATLFLLFFRRRKCKIIPHHVLRYSKCIKEMKRIDLNSDFKLKCMHISLRRYF